MIAKEPQGASPVTSPRTSAPGNVFSGVKTAAIDRLQFTVQNHNGIPNNIAMGRAVKPQASVSNEMAARALDFEPRPGRQPRQGMRLQVHNAPGPRERVDTVADAIQRYLNIKPRREPTADPKAEDSIARHPQQILQSASRWDDALPYQFSVNGVKNYQLQPEFRRWGGSLTAEVTEPGLTGVAAPATREPQPGPRDNPAQNPDGLVFAAQAAIREMRANEFEPMEPIVRTGPPNHTADPYFDPAFAAQNAMGRLRRLTERPGAEYVSVGAGGYSDRAYNDPESAYANAVNRTAENLARPQVLPLVAVGAGGYSDQYGNQPTVALAASMDRTHKNLMGLGPVTAEYEEPTLVSQKTVAANLENMSGPERPEIITVGAGNLLQSVHRKPEQAWISGTQAAVNLLAAPGTNLNQARAGALDQAYLRAMSVMRRDENFRLATQVLGRQA